jgi:hypothetical protein
MLSITLIKVMAGLSSLWSLLLIAEVKSTLLLIWHSLLLLGLNLLLGSSISECSALKRNLVWLLLAEILA